VLLPSIRRYDAAVFHLPEYVPPVDGAYRLVKARRPDVQLALVGSMAHDDPEGWDYYDRTVSYAGDDTDIFILSNLNNVGSVEVNAFQVHSAAVIQKSVKEGFGLTVSEALWKGRPMVAGRVGGIVVQIEDGVTGWLVSSAEEAAEACLEALADPAAARERALRGKEYVRRNFLTPRLLRDWLALFNRQLGLEDGVDLTIATAAAA
jgi:trehalose synthase